MKRWSVQGSLTSAIIGCLLVATAIEIVTCLLRFWFHLEASRDTSFLGGLTFGLRIHHGYVGLAVMLLGLLPARGTLLRHLSIAGAALVVSDLVHHFLVLWLVTGDPQFHLFYS
jgi:hypothetical protein